MCGIFTQAQGVLGSEHRIGLVRAEAAFSRNDYWSYLESQELPYIIVARLTAVVRKLVVHQIPSTGWRVVARRVEVTDLEVSLPNFLSGPRPAGSD